ncbi:MAG: class I SAM-dependent methyltransferase [Firmicutes bacterium]|nr:class I SAM-dependent methyltransferase [Bacillota bacterium]
MDCKICNNKTLDILELESIYYYCPKCNLIFIDEVSILDSIEEKSRYEEHENNHENQGYVRMFEIFIKQVIEPYISKTGLVLDFGCGPGPVLGDLLKERDFTVDQYDPYFFPERVFEGKKYDLITSTEVFEHLKDPLQEMDKLYEHLKKDAYLAIMTSFHPGIDDFADWWYKRDPTHITFYNSNTFKEIARKYNLEIVFEDRDKYCLLKKR